MRALLHSSILQSSQLLEHPDAPSSGETGDQKKAPPSGGAPDETSYQALSRPLSNFDDHSLPLLSGRYRRRLPAWSQVVVYRAMGAASSCDCTVTTHIRACFTPCPCPWPRPPAPAPLLPTPALVPPPVPVPSQSRRQCQSQCRYLIRRQRPYRPPRGHCQRPHRHQPCCRCLFRWPYLLCRYRWTRCQNHQYRRPRLRRSTQCQRPHRGQRCCRCQSRWPYLLCRYRWTRCQNLQYRRPRLRRSTQCQRPRRHQRCCRCQSPWPYLLCRYRWTQCQNQCRRLRTRFHVRVRCLLRDRAHVRVRCQPTDRARDQSQQPGRVHVPR